MITSQAANAVSMQERKEPRFIQFEQVGDGVFGILRSINRISITDKQTKKAKAALRYIVELPDTAEYVCFLGTYQIDTTLRADDIGRLVSVEYSDKRDTPAGKMKVFKIGVSDGRLSDENAHGLEITDDDLPF